MNSKPKILMAALLLGLAGLPLQADDVQDEGGRAAGQASRVPQRLPFRSAHGSAESVRSSSAGESSGKNEPRAGAVQHRPIPLPKMTDRKQRSSQSVGGLQALTTVGTSLAMVVGAFLLVVLALKRSQPKQSRLLPDEVVEVLGRKPLAGRTALQLIRLGNKLVLVAVTPDGAETVSEVTDAAQVDHLAGLCQQRNSGSISHSFAEILGGSETDSRRLRAKGRRS